MCRASAVCSQPVGHQGMSCWSCDSGWSVAGPQQFHQVVLQQRGSPQVTLLRHRAFLYQPVLFLQFGGGRNLVTSLFQIKEQLLIFQLL